MHLNLTMFLNFNINMYLALNLTRVLNLNRTMFLNLNITMFLNLNLTMFLNLNLKMLHNVNLYDRLSDVWYLAQPGEEVSSSPNGWRSLLHHHRLESWLDKTRNIHNNDKCF